MASLRNHQVMESWRTRLDPDHVVHFTKQERVVRTGTRGGSGKICYITEKGVLNFSGLGRRATVKDFRAKHDNMIGWERVS